MDITLILTFVIMSLVVVAPAVAVGLFCPRPGQGPTPWLRALLALLLPVASAYALAVAIWLPGHDGRCGGWLGETTACGFGQYATETAFMAAMTLAVPGTLGILLGLAVFLARLWKHRTAGPAS